MGIAASSAWAQVRPPSVPLVAHDPYFSIWSPADRLTDADTVHWTGARNALTGTASINGKVFRFMGKGPNPALRQTGLRVLPTRTVYTFEGAGIALEVRFTTPALPDDLDVLSRPATYLTLTARSTDGKPHRVAYGLGMNTEIAGVTDGREATTWRGTVGNLSVLSAGTADQPVLAKKGDGVRIDWGHLCLAAPSRFLAAARFEGATAALATKPTTVEAKGTSVWAILAYDDQFSIQYFRQNLRPYWRRDGDDIEAMLNKAYADYAGLSRRCEKFDRELMADLTQAGGEKYAQLCALAYGECLAGNKLVADKNGQPLLFPKENTSNGCIATSDVIYPMAPQFLLFGASLSKAMLVPILDYASSPRWKFPFAPHDIGTYPQANGQVYGGGERTEENQMPVEESANLLILVTAVAEMEGNADFAARYWPTLTKWAGYLKAKGFDPENQLCTDDFLGHLAHNVNLSAKAIIALKSYARLCEMRGQKAAAKDYGALAASFAQRWMKEADDGDHYRLTFDKPGTWSQKYNLVWDKILGLNLFPDSVRRKEVAYYRTVAKPYGVPLDSRGTGAKLDWSLWTATLTQNRDDFLAISDLVLKFVNETPQRVGMGDWYDTANAHHLFMHSRPVVGGVFLQMLYAKPVWAKWAKRDTAKAGGWAPIPKAPKVTMVVPAADSAPASWRYTTKAPGDNWFKPGFDDRAWSTGMSGFGTRETPGVSVNTVWDSSDIWLRREVVLTAAQLKGIQFWIHHDEGAEVYVNGVLALKTNGWTTQYEAMSLTPAGLKALKPGKNTIAVHCHQTSGGQYIDLGFVSVKP